MSQSPVLKSTDNESGSGQVRFAKVRFRDNVVLDVPVKKIKTKEGRSFEPTNEDDFDPDEVYSVKTAKFDAEGKGQRYYAFIGRMAGDLEKLNDETKRIRWPSRWPVELDEEPNITSQDEAALFVQPIEAQRNQNITRNNNKKRKAEGMMEKFLHSSPLTAVSNNGMEGTSNGTPGPVTVPVPCMYLSH